MIPQIAVDFICEHEAFRPTAYKPTRDDVWTIGWGHTEGVTEGMTCEREQAKNWLSNDLQTAARRLRIVIPTRADQLSVNQWSALLSFAFNEGAGADWDIWKEINEGRLENVPAQMRRFVYQKKRRIPGLVNRREDEIALWLRP